MKRFILDINTNGDNAVLDLSPAIHDQTEFLTGVGLLHLFIAGSTAGLTTLEFEPGLVKHDLPNLFRRLAPPDAHYYHEQTWNDDNGHAHVLSALLKPELTIPFEHGKLLTGGWQQIVLVDFDTRPRKRKVICTVLNG